MAARARMDRALRSSSLLAGGYVFLGSQAALDYVVRRAVEARGRTSRHRRRRRVAARPRCASRALRGRATSSTSRRATPRSPGRRSTSCRARSASTASARSSCPSTSRRRIEIRRVECRARSRCRSRSTCATSASSASNGRRSRSTERVSGIVFNYAGGAVRHEIRDLRFVAEQGTLAGTARLGANPPYELSGRFFVRGRRHVEDRQRQTRRSPARSSA